MWRFFLVDVDCGKAVDMKDVAILVATGTTGPVAAEVGVSTWEGAGAGRPNSVGGVWGMVAASPPVNARISLPERFVLAIYTKRLPYFQLASFGQSHDQCRLTALGSVCRAEWASIVWRREVLGGSLGLVVEYVEQWQRGRNIARLG